MIALPRVCSLGLSPCPNDTLIFGAWLKGWVGGDFLVQPNFLDIDQLNASLFKGVYLLTKASLFSVCQHLDKYSILPVGGATGYGVGPLLVKKPSVTKLTRVALPGEQTTARFLFELFGPTDLEKVYYRYDAIIPAIQSGAVDCGVVIHESRFLIEKEGLQKVADFGACWEEKENLPLPLGVLAVSRDVPLDLLKQLSEIVLSSIQVGKSRFPELLPYIQEKSIEKDLEVIRSHIDLYVNQESLGFSSEGKRAVKKFFTRGQERGFFPKERLFDVEKSFSFCNGS